MNNQPIPADAVREALDDITDYLGAALALEARLGEQTSQTTERAMQHAATALRIAHEKRTRLAALAGAGPVAWMSQGGDVSRSADYFREMGFPEPYTPLFTHAPAKAREVTPEMVSAACAGLIEHELGPRHVAHNAMHAALTAALATFAEGE